MNDVCPNCGYCPHCGQRRQFQPYTPYYGPVWVGNTPNTVGNTPNTTGGTTTINGPFAGVAQS